MGGPRLHGARAGVGGLATEHAVELDRVPDGFVNLQAELLAGQQERRPPRRACGRSG